MYRIQQSVQQSAARLSKPQEIQELRVYYGRTLEGSRCKSALYNSLKHAVFFMRERIGFHAVESRLSDKYLNYTRRWSG